MTAPRAALPHTAERVRILLVDDEPRVVDALGRTLRRHYSTVTATSGAEALAILARGESFAVIVSDMRMPEMDGAAFLSRASAIAPDAVRILLTGAADMTSAAAAVNEGGIFRFLIKPCASELLEASLAAAVERHRATVSERALLTETLSGSVRVLTDILALASPIAFSRSMRLQRIVLQLAVAMGLRDTWAIELAAMLSQLGAITVPPETLEAWYRGARLETDQRAAVAAIDHVTEQLIRHIPRLDAVRDILDFQAARFDGHGAAPGEHRGATLPIGARLLHIATDLDTLESAGTPPSAAIGIMFGRVGLYDPAALAALRDTAVEPTDDVREMRLVDVRGGMVFARDVVAHNGLVLIGRGQQVTPTLLQRIRNHWADLPLRQLPQLLMPAA